METTFKDDNSHVMESPTKRESAHFLLWYQDRCGERTCTPLLVLYGDYLSWAKESNIALCSPQEFELRCKCAGDFKLYWDQVEGDDWRDPVRLMACDITLSSDPKLEHVQLDWRDEKIVAAKSLWTKELCEDEEPYDGSWSQ